MRICVEKGLQSVEEKQILEFVQRVSQDEALRKELTNDPDNVIMREGFSPRVAQVLMRLVPHMSAISGEISIGSLTWWT